MHEMEVVKSQVDRAVTALQSTIRRYYDTLYELRRLTLILLQETTADPADIEKWFADENYGICPDGFWQNLSHLEQYRNGCLVPDAVSYSCHPQLRNNHDVSARMFALRNIGPFLKEIKERLPETAWIYYQDATNFALQFPYIDQATAITADFDWSTYHTWISVAPENNPERAIQWTAPSIDYAGKGLIISVSIPVYEGDTFTGVWSIDLPMTPLYSEYMFIRQIPEQQNFIADYGKNIIAHPLIETKIDKEKGAIYQQKLDYISKEFANIPVSKLISSHTGKLELMLEDCRKYEVLYTTIPELRWIFFSMFPQERMLDIVNTKIKTALDSVRNGDLSYRLHNIPDSAGSNQVITSFNEMAQALEAQQEQLRESQKQLVQSERLSAIGSLAGGIAHDFNNMLNVILGYGQELFEALHPDDPLRTFAQEILSAGKRSAELTHQLLAFSRKQPLQPKVEDINAIILNTERVLARLIGEDIELKTMLSKNIPPVLVDATQIEQVVINLAVNARDAMPDGGTLLIETTSVELDEQYSRTHVRIKQGTYVMLSVTDTGHGMDETTRKRIFDPFFTTKAQGKGTGLGLATVYGIVKQSGGYIWAYSEPGMGTTFKIYLPRTTQKTTKKSAPKNAMATQGNNAMILLVEDEPALRKLCEIMLKSMQYRVVSATGGEEALTLVKSGQCIPDLVITDVVMPEMNGKVLTDRLRRHIPQLKVLYVSGYTDNTIVHHGVLDSGIPFLQKPFTKKRLALTLKNILEPN
ncbi:ATP-binding protein [Desulfogranum japonicum]|uniref:ATP-binding protein n=1 Tax=Desulfogranum japonicum TaxID=231447 RepID=UPI00040C5B20|nr:ATP-binding protein [Desulfogranum japonicum]